MVEPDHDKCTISPVMGKPAPLIRGSLESTELQSLTLLAASMSAALILLFKTMSMSEFTLYFIVCRRLNCLSMLKLQVVSISFCLRIISDELAKIGARFAQEEGLIYV